MEEFSPISHKIGLRIFSKAFSMKIKNPAMSRPATIAIMVIGSILILESYSRELS